MTVRDAAIIICIFTVAGCVEAPRGPTPYTGPTEPMVAVVEAINANNVRVPTLWAKGYYEANIVDHGRTQFINGDINLVYRQPNEMRLVAKKDVAGTVFEVGSNAQQYWLTVKGDVDTMWHGRHDAVPSIDSKEMPIHPELMLDVLGVATIDTNFRQPPVPVMRFNNDSDAYMFVWSAPAADRWVAQKEVWYDRATKLPVKVILFDVNGRVVLRANLSNHKPVGDGGADGPRVAAGYKLYFPDSGTTMSFDLNELALRHGEVPNDRSFAFPREPGVNRIIDVDPKPANDAPIP